jgi:hypothetical protein
MEGKVVIIRLKMAQHPDIVCIMKDGENEGEVVLQEPHAIIPQTRNESPNNMELGLMPYIPAYSSERSITIPRSEIFLTFEPVEELRQRFNVQFGSGIITASKNNVVQVPTLNVGNTPA